VGREPEVLASLLTAGDDYEIVAAVPETSVAAFEAEAKEKGVTVTAIGRISGPGGGVSVLGPDGKPLELGRKGYAHF
jgi:thiamine-monophosphate kinase